MKQILPNKVENGILNILSTSYPKKASEVHKALESENITVSYKYVYKSLQNLDKQKIIEKKDSKYLLSKHYIKSLKSLVDDASKCYEINQNVFLNKLNSSILSILKKDEQDKIYNDMLKHLNGEILNKLDEWYSAYYDPENKEFKKIQKVTKLKGKNILELGCGTGRITFQLTKHAKSVTSVDNDDEYLNFCKEKALTNNVKNLSFIKKNITNLGTIKKKYDVIVSGWAGLYHSKNHTKLIKDLKSLLKKNGILIIIEAYPESEYIGILNAVRPKESKMSYKQTDFKKSFRN